MSPVEVGTYAIFALIALIWIGMPIGVGMLVVSFIGVTLIRNDAVAVNMMASVANDSLEEYLLSLIHI